MSYSIFKEYLDKFNHKIESADIKRLYDIAFDKGYDEGYDEGHDVGFDKGHDEGFEEGTEEADSEAYNEGFEEGEKYSKDFGDYDLEEIVEGLVAIIGRDKHLLEKFNQKLADLLLL